jgi:hypothetical protein
MSVLLLLETPVAALTAWWLLGQRVEAATVPGLLLIIVGVTIVVTKGGGEQAAPSDGTPWETEAPPYPAYPPYPPPPPVIGEPAGAVPHAARRDPRIEWARLAGDESPTLTIRLTYHGAGAFDTVYLRRPPEAGQEQRAPAVSGHGAGHGTT